MSLPRSVTDTYTKAQRRQLAASVPRVPRLTLFMRWAFSQTAGFRVGLFIGYLLTLAYGVSAIVAGVPAFLLTGSRDYSVVWSLLITASAAVCTVVSAFPETPVDRTPWAERIESVSVGLLFTGWAIYATIILYIAYGLGDATRISAGYAFIVIAGVMGSRAMWLAATAWRKVQRAA